VVSFRFRIRWDSGQRISFEPRNWPRFLNHACVGVAQSGWKGRGAQWLGRRRNRMVACCFLGLLPIALRLLAGCRIILSPSPGVSDDFPAICCWRIRCRHGAAGESSNMPMHPFFETYFVFAGSPLYSSIFPVGQGICVWRWVGCCFGHPLGLVWPLSTGALCALCYWIAARMDDTGLGSGRVVCWR